MHINPYLMFEGRCEEALDFYRAAVGAQIGMVLRFNESPDPLPPGQLAPGFEKKIMHSEFSIGDTKIMASDGCAPGDVGFKNFSLSLTVANEDEARRTFAALSDGGNVQMPLGKTFWSPLFGMTADRFGVAWMVMVAAAAPMTAAKG